MGEEATVTQLPLPPAPAEAPAAKDPEPVPAPKKAKAKKSKGKAKSKAKKPARTKAARTTPKRAVKRYDWDVVLDGKEHILERGKDFTGTSLAAASMVRYRARERKAKVTAEAIDDKRVRVYAGEHRGSGARPRATRK